jgi:hypothetical protein
MIKKIENELTTIMKTEKKFDMKNIKIDYVMVFIILLMVHEYINHDIKNDYGLKGFMKIDKYNLKYLINHDKKFELLLDIIQMVLSEKLKTTEIDIIIERLPLFTRIDK